MTDQGQSPQEDDIMFLQHKWTRLLAKIKEQFDVEPNMESILFLIGVRELGQGAKKFTKEEKVDLMHIALCAILAPSGYYELSHLDQEGWPHWVEVKPLPFINVFSQEVFLKSHVVDYFKDVYEL
jgi:hypothetical protein